MTASTHVVVVIAINVRRLPTPTTITLTTTIHARRGRRQAAVFMRLVALRAWSLSQCRQLKADVVHMGEKASHRFHRFKREKTQVVGNNIQ
jgi:hypothetical protein